MKTFKQYITETESEKVELEEGVVEWLTFSWNVIGHMFDIHLELLKSGSPMHIGQGLGILWILSTIGTIDVVADRIKKHWTDPRNENAIEKFTKSVQSDPALMKVIKEIESTPAWKNNQEKVIEELQKVKDLQKEHSNWKRRKVKPTADENKRMLKDIKNAKARITNAQKRATSILQKSYDVDLKHIEDLKLGREKSVAGSGTPKGWKKRKVFQLLRNMLGKG